MLTLTVTIDTRNLTKKFKSLERKQIPFASSLALNDTAFDARKNEQKRMYKQLDRPTKFTVRGVAVKKASKRKLQSVVFMKKNRMHYMKYQITGGLRKSENAGTLLLPARAIKRNKYGNVPGFANWLAGEMNHPRAYVTTLKKRNLKAVIRRHKKGRGYSVRALFVDSATYQRRLDFHKPIVKTAKAVFPIHFKRRMKQALRTAR